jgi:hypothetical protein
MIAFDLQCANGHTFEGWFEDNNAYKEQKKKDLISCPLCNTTEVSKILSPVAIKRSTPIYNELTMDQAQLAAVGKQIVDYVHKNFDDVGCDFAKEALKIHYGVSEPRNIRGMSTPEEEKTLRKEGIDYVKIPMPPTPDTESQKEE